MFRIGLQVSSKCGGGVEGVTFDMVEEYWGPIFGARDVKSTWNQLRLRRKYM